MTLWYFETRHPLGRWIPNTSPLAPQVRSRKGQPDRLGSDTGPRIRGVTQVHPDHARLTLDQLAQVYGPDGTLQATRPKPEEFPQ